MKQLFTFVLAMCTFTLLSFNLNAQTDKYAQSAIVWSDGPWYDAPTGGTVVTAPGAGDNVFTQGFNVTINSNATCDNITLTSANAQLTIGDGVTLTVRGLITSTVFSTGVNYFSNSHANSTLKLTGELAPYVSDTDSYLLVSDFATRAVRPANVIVAATDVRNYQWAENENALAPNSGTNSIALLGAGKFTVKTGTNLTFKTQFVSGQNATNELIVEEGAVLTTRMVRGSFANNHFPGTKVTINGRLNHIASTFSMKEIVVGPNGYFATQGGNRWNAHEFAWDGWWGSANISNPVLTGQFATPTSVSFAKGSTVEFNRLENQNINGVIQANKYYQGTTSTYTGVTAETALTPSFAITYSNIVVAGTNTKNVRSNLVSNGIIEVKTGTMNINSGVVLVNTGSIVGRSLVTVNGALVTAIANDETMGSVAATISSGNEVALVAVPKPGYQFVSWNEEGIGHVSSSAALTSFVPANASTRTLAAIFSVSTGVESSARNANVSVVGNNIRLLNNFKAVEVYDAVGKLVVADRNVSSVSVKGNGVYIVRLISENEGVITQKVHVK